MRKASFSNYNFLLDNSQGPRMVFISTAALEADTRAKVPLWWCEFPDQDNLIAMCAWVGARRHLWQDWGLKAEEMGFQAFAQYVRALTEAEPLEHVTGFAFHSPENDREMIVCKVDSQGRYVPILHHRFRTPRARRRFLDWLYRSENYQSAESMALTCWLAGPEILSELLDKIAADPSMELPA